MLLSLCAGFSYLERCFSVLWYLLAAPRQESPLLVAYFWPLEFSVFLPFKEGLHPGSTWQIPPSAGERRASQPPFPHKVGNNDNSSLFSPLSKLWKKVDCVKKPNDPSESNSISLCEFSKAGVSRFLSKAREFGFLLRFAVGAMDRWVVSRTHTIHAIRATHRKWVMRMFQL